MYVTCMATKTISIDLKAHERLRWARRSSAESFSQVIHRAVWPDQGKTCGALLQVLEEIRPLPAKAIKHLEKARSEDVFPEDSWSES